MSGHIAVCVTIIMAAFGGLWAVFTYIFPPGSLAKTKATRQKAGEYPARNEEDDFHSPSSAPQSTIQIPLEELKQLIADQSNAASITDLAKQLGVHETAVQNMLRTLGEYDVPLEQLSQRLSEIAARHLELERRLRELTSDDPEVARLRAEAAQALEQGQYDAVDTLLDQALKIDANALEQQQQVLDQRKRSAAETLGLRGELAQTRLQYVAAADYFARAAKMVPKESSREQWNYQHRQANALYLQGEEFGVNQALEECIALCLSMLKQYSKIEKTLDLYATRNKLGDALRILGEREHGIKRFEQALGIYMEALIGFSREQFPQQWADTQNNLGIVLAHLGERTQDTNFLELAVGSYQGALQECTRKHNPRRWATMQNNLGNVLQTLGEFKSNTEYLEQAVDAFRIALSERPREIAPLEWATTQNNLGAALQALGECNSDTKLMEQAVDAYRAALEEWTDSRTPSDWAGVQINLGNALAAICERTGSLDGLGLEETAANLREAIIICNDAPYYQEGARQALARIEKLLSNKEHSP
jgi:tetratricopeptide (TPR) repeat protein